MRVVQRSLKTQAVFMVDRVPTLWQFPDEDEQIFREAEAYRSLPVKERLQRIMAVIELGLAMQDANPRRDVVRELRLLDEEEQRQAFGRIFEHHESQRDAVAGRG